MDMGMTDVDDNGSPFFLFPVSPGDLKQNVPTTDIHLSNSTFDPILKDMDLPADESFLSSLNLLYGVDDSGDLSCSTSGSCSSPTEQDDYNIISLDEVSSTTDILSCFTDTVSSTGDDVPVSTDESVTSKLKSVLMSRQRQKNSDMSNQVSTINSLHSYVHQGNAHNINKNVSSSLVDNRPTGNSLRFPPCSVCGGTASGLHYGVNSCEPCKGFFTRYLRKKDEYKCDKDGDCTITNRLRGNCSACRLKKCLALGMSRKNSRLGRYSLARRMETIMQVNKLEGKQTIECSADKPQRDFCDTDTTFKSNKGTKKKSKPSKHRSSNCKVKSTKGYSQKLIKSLVTHMDDIKPYGEELVSLNQINEKLTAHYESFELKQKLFGDMKTIPKEEYFTLRKTFGIEIDCRMMYLKDSAQEVVDVISRYCTFAKQIPQFTSLSNRDQSNLLKSSRYDFFMILMHEGYHHEHQVFLAHNGVAFHREEVADKFFSRRLVYNVCDMYHRLQKLQLNKEEKALLIAIALVFTDRCILENPSLVEQIQFSLTQLLRNQLEKTCRTSATLRFTKIIDCLTVMRESSELYLREYSQLCEDEQVIEEVPIMTAMLFEDL